MGNAVDLGKGWSARRDPARPESGIKEHVHVYGPRGEHQAWNADGSKHDARSHAGIVPRRIREAVKEKFGINIPD